MTSEVAVSLSRDLLWTALLITGPILLFSLLVGLFISVIQVITQIQEMSLTFIPKIVTVALTLIVLGSWMLGVLVQFGTKSLNFIAQL